MRPPVAVEEPVVTPVSEAAQFPIYENAAPVGAFAPPSTVTCPLKSSVPTGVMPKSVTVSPGTTLFGAVMTAIFALQVALVTVKLGLVSNLATKPSCGPRSVDCAAPGETGNVEESVKP